MKKRRIIWIAIPLVAATALGSHYWPRPLSTRWAVENVPQREAGAFSVSGYASLLRQYTTAEGWVRYRQLKGDRRELDGFAGALARLSREEYESWNEEAQLAFWINTYNALTLVAIVDHYPAQRGLSGLLPIPFHSIREIPGVWDNQELLGARSGQFSSPELRLGATQLSWRRNI